MTLYVADVVAFIDFPLQLRGSLPVVAQELVNSSPCQLEWDSSRAEPSSKLRVSSSF